MPVKKEETVSIPAINIQQAIIKVVGDSALIMHKWSEKAKKEILDKQMKKAKTKSHDAKDPVRDFIDSLYWLDGEPEEKTEEGFARAIQSGARFGFPSTAFKAAAVSAGYRSGITKDKVSMNAAFHIDGEFVEIHGIPEMREDMVRSAWERQTSGIAANLKAGMRLSRSNTMRRRSAWSSLSTCLILAVLPAV